MDMPDNRYAHNIETSGIRKKGMFIFIPLFLLLAGSFIICYAGWNLFSQTYLLSRIFFVKPDLSISENKFIINDKPMERPKLGSYIGKIIIPSVSVDYPLLHGDSDRDLRKGAGHYAGSTLPGENGNCIISGHNTTVFKDLGGIKIGDIITIQTYYGTFNYKVYETKITYADDRTVITSSDKEMLTVYTCYPFRYIGLTPDRFVVLAEFLYKTDAIELPKQMEIEGGK